MHGPPAPPRTQQARRTPPATLERGNSGRGFREPGPLARTAAVLQVRRTRTLGRC
jgi:hypothetical protein